MATFGPYTFDAEHGPDEGVFRLDAPSGVNVNPNVVGSGGWWIHGTDGTPSSGGPTDGQGGTDDGFLFTESSSPTDDGDQFILTCLYVFDGDQDLEFEFYWSMRDGSNTAAATIDLQTSEDGGAWTTRGSFAGSGTGDSSGTDPSTWNLEDTNLSSLVSGSSVRVRLVVTMPTPANSSNDVGIDTITITGELGDPFYDFGEWQLIRDGSPIQIPAGSNRLLTVAIGEENNEPTGVTYDGTAMTEQVLATAASGSPASASFWTIGETDIAAAAAGGVVRITPATGHNEYHAWARFDEDIDQTILDTDSDASGTFVAGDLSLSTASGGKAFALSVTGNSGVTQTWTGVTEDDEFSGHSSSVTIGSNNNTDGNTLTISRTGDTGTVNRESVVGMSLSPAAGSNVAVGQASETDTAQAITGQRIKPVGLASETDTAQTITPTESETVVSVGQASETDVAQAVNPQHVVAVGLASEADTAQAITGQRFVDVGLASETDSAQVIDPVGQGAVAVGLTEETDTAQPVTAQRILQVGQASETDTAQDITPAGPTVVAVGLASETNVAFSVGLSRLLGVGLVEEADSAQAVTFRREFILGLTSETDTAQPVDALGTRILEIGLVEETDSGFPVTPIGGVAVVSADRGAGSGRARAQSRQSFVHVRDFIQRQRDEEEELIMSLLEEVD